MGYKYRKIKQLFLFSVYRLVRAVLFLVLTLGRVFQYGRSVTVYRIFLFHCRTEFNAVRSLIFHGLVLYPYLHEVGTVRKIISWIPLGGGSDYNPRRNNGVEKSHFLEKPLTHSPVNFHETVHFSACLNFA